ncbi:MAG: hypothetical protein J1E04_00595 [Alistipes sp.]|nr:hypothetical protein [Alistipes sp.]
MKSWVKYLLSFVLWVVVAVYILWASSLVKRGYAETVIEGYEIDIADSTADRRLVTERMVREWLEGSGIRIEGSTVAELDVQGIERAVADNGFVGKVSAYASADGILRIEVRQRTPLLRLLTDGYDRYITEDGFVFGTPSSSAIYVPVVTGGFKPMFPADYEGDIADYRDMLISGENGIVHNISELRKRKAEIEHLNEALRGRIKEWRRVNTKIRWWNSEATREWKKNRETEKVRQIALKEDSIRRNRRELMHIGTRLSAERNAIKKTEEKYEDLLKLLNFVERLENDKFWQSEIVQIVAARSASGVLELKLIPRSGSFVIEFGAVSNVEAKLDKLMKFYSSGLRNRGWNEYSVVSVAYKGQVVCRKAGR